MHPFDKEIHHTLKNVMSMLKARRHVLELNRDNGPEFSFNIKRHNDMERRIQHFIRDWEYWYYDSLPGSGLIRELPRAAAARQGKEGGIPPKSAAKRNEAIARKSNKGGSIDTSDKKER